MSKKNKFFIVGIYSMMFMAAVGSTTQGIMLTHYIDFYNLKSVNQGMMSTAQSIGQFASLFIVGFLIGKFRKSGILAFSAFVVAVIFFVISKGIPFTFFILLYAIYGLAFGFIDSLASSIMVDYFKDRSAAFMNLLHGIYGVGGLAGPLLIKWGESCGFTWQMNLVVIGVLSSIASVIYISAAAVRRVGSIELDCAARKTKLTDVTSFLMNKKGWLLVSCAFLYGSHQIGITVWIVRYISDYLETPQWGPIALSAFWIAIATSRLMCSRLKISKYAMLWKGHLLSGIVVVLGVLSGNGFIMMICTGICGFAEGAILPLTLDIACHWTIEKTSVGSSVILFAHYMGSIITPLIMALVISEISIKAGMIIPGVLSLMAAVLAIQLNKIEGI